MYTPALSFSVHCNNLTGIFLMTKAIAMLLICNFTNTVNRPGPLSSGQQVKIALLSTVKVF